MERTLTARNAVALSFFLNGFGFASWISRIPEARHELSLSNGGLGLLLLAISAGSVLTLPSSGVLINRFGPGNVVRFGISADALGLVLVSVGTGLLGNIAVTAVGLFIYGLGVGLWDVAMNVEGATVERLVGRTIMPRFHAGFSFGTVMGAAVGALTTAAGLPLEWHLVAVAGLIMAAGLVTTGRFLPAIEQPEAGEDLPAQRSAWSAWLEPRTLLIGAMVFALALTEGTANDWLAVSLIDGYDVERWVGVAGFGLFVVAMTGGRLFGPAMLDRFGRVPVLWSTIAAAAMGVVLIVFGGSVLLVVVGIVLWGIGASLGFPVGMSAASDDEAHAAARVSVVSTIAYTAFLAGPPLLGFLADEVGTLKALLAVAVLLVPSALLVPAARKPAH
ncbi:MFS transporter [Nocardioides sp.]|uniref:MFS transporter n=1 Tax=Nocardioides sp. TaxID=35761 RepID=UPI003D0C2607